MSEHDAPIPAAFLDLWQDKLFLGQEFLSWLWLSSEMNSRLITLKNHGPVELWFENRIQLESGEGRGKKSVACQVPGDAPQADWAEAYIAIVEGKKISRARLSLRTEDKEWGFTLPSDSLTPQSVKFPKTFTEGEDAAEEGEAGRFIERMALMNELISILEGLFKQFLKLRLSPQWLDDEAPRLSKWLAGQIRKK